MKVLGEVHELEVLAGGSGQVPLGVVNLGDVIDEVSVRALGLPGATIRADPERLTLFPDESGSLVVAVSVPDTFPAGTYPATFVVGSRSGGDDAYHDLVVTVPAAPRVRVAATPTIVRARRRAAFDVEVENTGNVGLVVALRAADADHRVRTTLTPATVTVAAGERATSTVVARGPRRFTGAVRDMPLRVGVDAEGAHDDVDLVLRQRPLVGRGLLTAGVLCAIVALWALGVFLGLVTVLGQDPAPKIAGPSFFAAQRTADDGAGAALGPGDAQGGTGLASTRDGVVGAVPAAPQGMLPKGGTLPVGVGGTVTGTVVAATSGEGVGRVTVEAWRAGQDLPDSSTATSDDGTYTLSGLFPGAYTITAHADGYASVWFPAGRTAAGAAPVVVHAREVGAPTSLTIEGDPASVVGHVETGEEDGTVAVVATARPAWAGADPTLAYDGTVADDGTYTFTGLPAPGTYEVSLSAKGYVPATTRVAVVGGQERFALDARLGAGEGTLRGTVTAAGEGLGEVTVSTTAGGEAVKVGTPSTGVVGSFVLAHLETPGTYVLTFRKDGYGTQRKVFALGPGETQDVGDVVLVPGTDTISGRVVDGDGVGVGGVDVAVGGAAAAESTTTLTTGDVGSFEITGVGSGDAITLTFTRDGYTPVSVPVRLAKDGTPEPVRVTLSSALGTVSGVVTVGGTRTSGVTVTATDGDRSWTTISTDDGSGAGAYLFTGLPPGRYTLTVSRDDRVVATGLVAVRAGEDSPRNLPVPGVG